MRRNVLLPFLVLLLAGAGFHCKPGRVHPPVLTGKLVMSMCSFSIVQVVSGNVDTSKISASWHVDFLGNDTTFTDVFLITNGCDWTNGQSVARGDLFTFRFTDSISPQNCMHCEMAVPIPPKSDAITDVHKIATK